MKNRMLTLFAMSLLFLSPVFGQQSESRSFSPAFYAFENGVSFGSLDEDAKTLRDLGYAGISQTFSGGEKLAQRIAAFDKAGMKVLSVYLNVGDTPIAAELIKPLANRDALIEITVRKKTAATVAAVRQTAETASQLKIRVALYPHHGNDIATMPQAMELIAQVDHPNLGVMFNLCHFLKNEKAEDLELVLENAGSRLFAVSTCGATLGGQGWGELIRPLDQGNFPQLRLLRALKKMDFQGPVGLQCYGVPGDKRTNLSKSIAAWNRLLAEL